MVLAFYVAASGKAVPDEKKTFPMTFSVLEKKP